MKNLQDYFDANFENVKITNTRLLTFADNNILNMTNNNPASIYDTNISNTQNRVEILRKMINTKTSDIGTRMGGTSEKDTARAAIEKYVANYIGTARGSFGGKDTKGYIETFPNGMDSFYRVTKEDFSINVNTLVGKAGKYVGVLGIPFQTAITNLYASYTTSSEEQKVDATSVDTDIVNENTAAQNLGDALTDNLYDIAKNNKRSTTAVGLYFNVSLLFPEKHKEIKKGTPAAGADVVICPIVYSPGKRINIHNKGASTLIFGMMLKGIKVGEFVTLAPNEESKEAFDFYFSNGDELYVMNTGAIAGIFQLYIIS